MEIKIFEKVFDWEQVQTVTSRDLYRFLQLDKSNYSKWSKNNIIENIFAEKWKDYDILLVLNDEWKRWKFAQNYLLNIDFAKKLCLQSKSIKWEEVRKYFIEVEKRYKKLFKDKLLLEKHKYTDEYIQNRINSKIVRKTFTDIIKDLEDYFVEQGYNSGWFLYSNYTNIITKNMFNFNDINISYINKSWKKKNRNKKEFLSAKQLKKYEAMEEKIWDFIKKETNNKTFCKEIYNKVKYIMELENKNFWLEIIIDNQLLIN